MMIYRMELRAVLALAVFVAPVICLPAGAVRPDPRGSPSRPSASAQAADRGVTPQQRALGGQAAAAGCAVDWDAAVGAPRSVRGPDLGARRSYSRGRGLVVGGRGDFERDAIAVMDNLSGLFRVGDAEQEFRARKVHADRLGFRHVRLQQYHRGYRVAGGEVIVHFNRRGKAYEVNGRYVAEIAVAASPAIDAAAALSAAQADLVSMGLPPGATAGDPEPVVFARRGPARLAYAVTLLHAGGPGGPGRWRYHIDAVTGAVLDRYNDIQHIPAPTTNGFHAAVTGEQLAGENGTVTNVAGWYDNVNTNFYLYNTNRQWIVENVAPSGWPDANTYAHRATNDWGDSDPGEISLARNFDVTQRYFSDRHGLFSFDGFGIIARANIHEGVNYVNAYWDGSEFYFGDGDGFIANSLATMDIAGHEYAHAVTEYSAGLVYAYESGALNESFSDIIGTCVEFFGQPDDRASYPAENPGLADWLLGEDSWLASTALRDMRDPANAATVGAGNEQPTRYLGTYWYSGTGDNGGVHQNSGVQNFFFYLLCEGGSGTNDGIVYSVTGIGITNAEQIAFRALTAYCVPNTGYRAVRGAWLSAAQDLNPAWAPAVAAAWDAVGVQAVSITPVGDANFSGAEGGPFSPASFVYVLTNADASSAGWGVSHLESWVTVAPSGGTLAAFGSQAVTVSLNGAAALLPVGSHADTLAFTNSSSAVTESRGVNLLVLPPEIYAFNLDANPGWTVEGAWAFGQPQGLGGASFGFPDPTSGATGTNVFGINLAGDYSVAIGGPYYLTTGPLDFTGHTNVQMIFQRWLNTDYPPYVYQTIETSTNGTNWVVLWTNPAGEEVAEDAWSQVLHDLSVLADGQPAFRVRWGHRVGQSGAFAYSGWNVDDIRFHGQPADDLRVKPGDGLNAVGYEGGPFAPTSRTYSVTNAGAGALPWTASTTSAWLSLSSGGGLLGPGATDVVQVALNAAADALTPGTYQASVLFSNSASGHTLTRGVTLQVNAIPGEIGVTDTVSPVDDLLIPFGDVIVGLSRTENITVTNSDPVNPLVISRISFGEYYENFDDGLAQDWMPANAAHWSVTGGAYRADAAADAVLMQSVYTGRKWTDATAQVTVRRTGDDSAAAVLILRATDDFDWSTETGSAYLFGISANGSYYVGKYVGGIFSFLQSWTASPFLNTGTNANVVKATLDGTAVRVSLNGNPVFTGSDSSITAEGRMGVMGYSGFAPVAVHYYDEITVGDPEPPAPVSGAQAWYNARSAAGGTGRSAPAGSAPEPYEGADYGPGPGTQVIVSGPFSITGEPGAFPYSIPANSSITFSVTYAPLLVASNEGEVVIESNDDDEPEVHVALTGRGIADYLQISPSTGLVSRGHPGGPFDPDEVVYALTNTSGSAVSWTAGATQAWVTVAPSSGSLGAASSASVTVSINAAASSLPEGVYGDSVVFSNATTTIAQARPVSLTVFTSPIIEVVPASFSVTNAMGQSQTNVMNIANDAAADGNLTFRLSSRNQGSTPLPFSAAPFVSRIEEGQDLTKLAPGREFVPGELLVRFADGVSGAARASVLASLGGGDIRREYRLVPGLTLVRLPPGAKVGDALVSYNAAPGVVYAAPNYIVRAVDTIPDDALFSQLWGMHNTGQTGGTPDADIDAPAAWDVQVGSTGVVVAVIDTGVDYNHEDLAGNMWVNPGEIAGNLIDDDFNGYVDDVYGINAITGSGDPMDDNDHGTHVAGTIGAVGDNGVGVAGVCWRVRIMGAKFLGAGGSGSIADAVTAVEYATMMGARVMNNSWGGGGYNQALKDAIDAAAAAEIVFAAAAGNSGSDNDAFPNYPSNYESSNVVAVLSTDHNDDISGFSSYGQTTVDLGAPGSSILSCKRGGGYVSFNGTSMATPHVAGAAALLLAANPLLTAVEIKDAMMDSVDVLFPTLCVSGGRLNLDKALQAVGIPWLTMNPLSASNMPPGSATNIDVGFHAGELDPAVYHGEILVSCNDVTNPLVVVPVTMTVLPDDLRVTPSQVFTAGGIVGGPFAPGSQAYTLTNFAAATGAVPWTASADVPWVTVSPTSSTLAAGTVTTVLASINGAANALTVGVYNADITFSNSANGVAQKRKVKLNVSPVPVDGLAEMFASSDNDLDYRTATFTPVPGAPYYAVCRYDSITSFPTDPAGGTALVLTDDSFVQVVLTGGLVVPFFGAPRSNLFVGSNGYITFGSGNSEYTESFAAHYALPRISGVFDDLHPGNGGTVSWKQLADRVAVTWNGVPEYSNTGTNSFQIEIFSNGVVRITWLGLTLVDGLSGLSKGLGQPPGFVESDLSAYGVCAGPVGFTPASPSDCDMLVTVYNAAGRPLEGSGAVFASFSYDGGPLSHRPMGNAGGDTWRVTNGIPPGAQSIAVNFRNQSNDVAAIVDDNGGLNWSATVSACVGLAITNPPSSIVVAATAGVHAVGGYCNTAVYSGQLTWTNPLTGGGGTSPVQRSWAIVGGVPLGVGTNVITVRVPSGQVVVAAADHGTNAPYSDGWTSVDNGGLGWTAWTQVSFGAFAQHVMTTADPGNLSAGPRAWTLAASNGSTAEARRDLIQPLAVGQTLALRFDNNWIENGFSVGMGLQNLAGSNLFEFMFIGGDANYIINDETLTRVTSIGWSGDGWDIAFRLTSSTQYLFTCGTNAVTGNLRPSGNMAVSRLKFWNYSAGATWQYGFYFNDLSVTSLSAVSTSATVSIVRSSGLSDSDGDGMPDGWELLYGLNPAVSNLAGSNADGDLYTDLEEYIADTNPTNGASQFPRLVFSNGAPGVMMLIVDPSSTARVYQVNMTTNLMQSPPSWQYYAGGRTGTGTGVTFAVTNDVPHRSYRAGVNLPSP